MCELTDNEIQQFKREITQKLGCRIKEIRLQKKLTQTELANRINSDRQYLYKIEKGKVGLSVVKLFTLLKHWVLLL